MLDDILRRALAANVLDSGSSFSLPVDHVLKRHHSEIDKASGPPNVDAPSPKRRVGEKNQGEQMINEQIDAPIPATRIQRAPAPSPAPPKGSVIKQEQQAAQVPDPPVGGGLIWTGDARQPLSVVEDMAAHNSRIAAKVEPRSRAASNTGLAAGCAKSDSKDNSVSKSKHKPKPDSNNKDIEKTAAHKSAAQHLHPQITLSRAAVRDSRLVEVLAIHWHWLSVLTSSLSWNAHQMYTACIPCPRLCCGCTTRDSLTESKQVPTKKCRLAQKMAERKGRHTVHGIEFVFFLLSGAIVLEGYDNHASIRKKADLSIQVGQARVCSAWALRRAGIAGLQCDVDCGGCSFATLKPTNDGKKLAGRQRPRMAVHSFWLLEELARRIYHRLPSGERTRKVENSMEVLGIWVKLDSPAN